MTKGQWGETRKRFHALKDEIKTDYDNRLTGKEIFEKYQDRIPCSKKQFYHWLKVYFAPKPSPELPPSDTNMKAPTNDRHPRNRGPLEFSSKPDSEKVSRWLNKD
ncbi:hypothetical protein AA105894_1683 [Asaia spathodeae NBRC 105894]|nr:hypothetical protein AA105894_1683 [Asaia spathodeae NBRC 105894]